MMFHASSCPIELKAQLMSQLSIKLWFLPVVHDNLWKWLLQVVCIFPIFIAFSHKCQWKIWLVHDKLWKWLPKKKLWKWLLQVVCIFPIFIVFSHKRQWKILVLPTSNTLNLIALSYRVRKIDQFVCPLTTKVIPSKSYRVKTNWSICLCPSTTGQEC